MVKKIMGFDEDGKKVFEREAREYDRSLGNTVFGVTIGDVVKAIPIIFLCGIVYANQQNVNTKIMDSMEKINFSSGKNADAISGIKEVLQNLNIYLSATTGKPFKDGMPK